MFDPHIARIDKGHWPLTFKPVTREPYIRDRSNYTFSDSLQQEYEIDIGCSKFWPTLKFDPLLAVSLHV